MKTEQNRLVVAAQALRISAGALRRLEKRIDDEALRARANALTQIESAAEELETAPPIDPVSIRRAALEEAVAIVNQCRDDEETDLRAVRSRIEHAAKNPDPDGAARG